MTLDGLTLNAVIRELQETIIPSKVQKIYMPTKEEIVLHMHTPQKGNVKLAISANAGECSLRLTEHFRQNPKTAPPFCMLLRKYLTGARVSGIEQKGLNRVADISFISKDELMREITPHLIVEIMGKYSNIILTDGDFKILDSIRRVGADISSLRAILPGCKYTDPPQQKLNPCAMSTVSLTEALLTKKDTLMSAHITSIFDGISNQTAEEILYRAGYPKIFTGDVTEKIAERIAFSLKNFLNDTILNTKPVIQFDGDGLPVFFSTIPYKTYPEEPRMEFDSANKMLDYYYTTREENFRLAQQRDSLSRQLTKMLAKTEKLIRIYRSGVDEAERLDGLKYRADAITSNIYRLKKGMPEFEHVNYETGKSETIQLDPSMTPQEAAQKIYKKIAKIKKAASINAEKLIIANDDRDFLLSSLHFAQLTKSSQEISEIKASLAQAGFTPKPPKNKARKEEVSQPLKYTAPGGYTVLVGKNDRQNDILTLKTASKDDIWFHTQKIAGSHVVLFTGGKELADIENEAVEFAASLAAAHSGARQSGKTAVDYTQRKNIKKPPGAHPGKVIYDDYFTVYVEPAQAALNETTTRPVN